MARSPLFFRDVFGGLDGDPDGARGVGEEEVSQLGCLEEDAGDGVGGGFGGGEESGGDVVEPEPAPGFVEAGGDACGGGAFREEDGFGDFVGGFFPVDVREAECPDGFPCGVEGGEFDGGVVGVVRGGEGCGGGEADLPVAGGGREAGTGGGCGCGCLVFGAGDEEAAIGDGHVAFGFPAGEGVAGGKVFGECPGGGAGGHFANGVQGADSEGGRVLCVIGAFVEGDGDELGRVVPFAVIRTAPVLAACDFLGDDD